MSEVITTDLIIREIDRMYARNKAPDDFTKDIFMDEAGLVTISDVQRFHNEMVSAYGKGLTSYNHRGVLRIKHIPYYKNGRKVTTWSKEFGADHRAGWEYDDQNRCTVCHGKRHMQVTDVPYIRLVSSRTCCGELMICRTHWSNQQGRQSLIGLSYHCNVCKAEVFQ